jgi:internalin A
MQSVPEPLISESLDLFNSALDDAAIERLVAPRPKLQSLNLSGTAIGAGPLRALSSLRELEVLHLGWTAIGDADLVHLAPLVKLRHLKLSGTSITDAGVRSLRLPILERLELDETAISDAAIEALEASAFASLRHLDLSYTRITPAAVPALNRLVGLRTLIVRGTPLGANPRGLTLTHGDDALVT